MKRLLMAVLALAPASLPAQEIPRIEHQPPACVLKDRFWQLEAVLQPPELVTRSRLYFTAPGAEDYYYVEMAAGESGQWLARLPKPKADQVSYFLEVLSPGGELQRTPETRLSVVKDAQACPEGGAVAPEAPKGDVAIVASTVARPKKPGVFGGVSRVTSAVPPEPKSEPKPEPKAEPKVEPKVEEKKDKDKPKPSGTWEVAPPRGDVAASPGTPPMPPLPTPAPPPVSVPAAQATPFPAATPGPVPSPSPTPRPVATEFPLGPEDIVKVTVIGHDDLSVTLIVQPDGTFIYPLLGRVKAADLTPRELEKSLIERLGKGYIRNPQISVVVQEYKSKTVMVMGEVSRPGAYPMTSNLRIIDLLAKAGMNTAAATQVQIIRPLFPTDRPLLPAEVTPQPGGEPAVKQAEILKVDLRAIQTGDLDKNIALQPNDTVYVPPVARFYVTGETRNTGAFTWQANLSVREAIILAGGFGENASQSKIRVIREVDGQKKELKIKPDDVVQPGDIIVVKGKLF